MYDINELIKAHCKGQNKNKKKLFHIFTTKDLMAKFYSDSPTQLGVVSTEWLKRSISSRLGFLASDATSPIARFGCVHRERNYITTLSLASKL